MARCCCTDCHATQSSPKSASALATVAAAGSWRVLAGSSPAACRGCCLALSAAALAGAALVPHPPCPFGCSAWAQLLTASAAFFNSTFLEALRAWGWVVRGSPAPRGASVRGWVGVRGRRRCSRCAPPTAQHRAAHRITYLCPGVKREHSSFNVHGLRSRILAGHDLRRRHFARLAPVKQRHVSTGSILFGLDAGKRAGSAQAPRLHSVKGRPAAACASPLAD
jgi:hypothetical protein